MVIEAYITLKEKRKMAKLKTQKVRFNVTAVDIRDGTDNHCFRCPVARSAIRKIEYKNSPWIVTVGTRHLIIGHLIIDKNVLSAGRILINLPEPVVSFIANYDSGSRNQRFRPFSFELNVPVKVLSKTQPKRQTQR